MVRFSYPQKQSQQRIFVVLYEIFKEHRFLWAIIIMFWHPYHIFKIIHETTLCIKVSTYWQKIPVTTRVAGYILNVKVSNSGDVLCLAIQVHGDISEGWQPFSVRSEMDERPAGAVKRSGKQFAPDSKNLLISPIFLENGSGKKDLIRNFRRNS